MSDIVVAALYQFTPLQGLPELQEQLQRLCSNAQIKGILLLAHEGINGTVAGSRDGINQLKAFLETRFHDLEYKESWAETMPFHRMKVRLKKEIVTLGVPSVDPSQQVGTYVNPQNWNQLISEPDVLLLDTRNMYEIEIGTFQGATNPQTQSFTEFPDFVKTIDKTKYKKVAMCCTGGIRCEKASSYMLSQGFEEVYHLKGGILKYLETIPEDQSLWKGECFVFDGRVSVGHGLELGNLNLCYGCRHPIDEQDKNSPFYEAGVSCPHCYSSLTPKKKESARMRCLQEQLARQRGTKHIGAVRKTLP